MATKSNNRGDEKLSFAERLKSAALESGAKKDTHEYLRDWFRDEHDILISTAMISRYGPKKRELPHMQQCRDYAVALGVCVEWLYSGRGARYPESGIQTGMEGRILALWRKWTPIVKYYAFEQLDQIDGKQNRIERHGDPNLTNSDVNRIIVETISETGEFKVPKNGN